MSSRFILILTLAIVPGLAGAKDSRKQDSSDFCNEETKDARTTCKGWTERAQKIDSESKAKQASGGIYAAGGLSNGQSSNAYSGWYDAQGQCKKAREHAAEACAEQSRLRQGRAEDIEKIKKNWNETREYIDPRLGEIDTALNPAATDGLVNSVNVSRDVTNLSQ